MGDKCPQNGSKNAVTALRKRPGWYLKSLAWGYTGYEFGVGFGFRVQTREYGSAAM
jgi:hypothetical protein